MKLLFDIDTVDVELYPGPASDRILKCFKHLQHVPTPMRDWDYPFYLQQHAPDELVDQLINHAKPLGIDIDPAQCQVQSYLNDLHIVYENNSDGKSQWLNFHECIHRCEEINGHWRSINKYLTIDYREISGPLVTEFDQSLLDQCTTDLRPGDVTVGWSELGKTPYSYWTDKEPNDITRICELVKPYLNFRPMITVPMQQVRVDYTGMEEFNQWWREYEPKWCEHWNVAPWTTASMIGRIVIGRVRDFDRFSDLLRSGRQLTRVTL